jgi:hypothetical protein
LAASRWPWLQRHAISALSEERRVFTKVRDDALAKPRTINASAERQGKNVDQTHSSRSARQTQEANSKIDERRFSLDGVLQPDGKDAAP